MILKKDIKMIALDLDGTLFNNRKVITKHTIQTLEAAIQNGITVVPATGRPASGIPAELTAIQGIRYALTSNGASVIDLYENKIIYSDLIPIKEALMVIDFLDDCNCLIDIFLDGTGYARKDSIRVLHKYASQEIVDYILRTRKFIDEPLKNFIIHTNHPVEKIHLLFQDLNLRSAIMQKLNELPDICVTTAISNNIEINSKTANKGASLLSLGRYLGLVREQIMACGDSSNDLDMIAACGFGVAMGNADSSLKKIADYVTKSNEEDGVSYAIEKFVLGTV